MIDDDSDEKVTRLLVDDPSDFGFHAAYLAYSKAWVENPYEEARFELNKIMLSLTENKEDFSTFYQRINQYRKTESSNLSDRGRFKVQRKRAWRKSEAKKIRISRHKK